LTNQLKFVLSFLDITNSDSTTQEAVAVTGNTENASQPTDVAAGAGAGAVVENIRYQLLYLSNQSASRNNGSEVATYASITASNLVNGGGSRV